MEVGYRRKWLWMAITFSERTYVWFDGLNLDNSKAYFVAHRAEYREFVAEPLNALMGELAERLGGSVKVFRPNRDIRFTTDKSPYRTHAAGHVRVGGGGGGHLYFQISPEGVFAATGVYEMTAVQLARYRAALSTDSKADEIGLGLEKILEELRSCGCEIEGERLKSLPRGIAKETPNADFLRYKSLYTSFRIDPAAAVDISLTPLILDFWGKTEPLRNWLVLHAGSE